MAVLRRCYPDDTLGRHGWFVLGEPFDPPKRTDFRYTAPPGISSDPTLDKKERQV